MSRAGKPAGTRRQRGSRVRHCAACRCRGCASGNLAPAAQSGAATSPPLAGKISGAGAPHVPRSAWPPESCLASERCWSCLRLPCSSCCRSAPATLLRLPRAWGRGGPAGSEDKVLKDECGVPFFSRGSGGPTTRLVSESVFHYCSFLLLRAAVGAQVGLGLGWFPFHAPTASTHALLHEA